MRRTATDGDDSARSTESRIDGFIAPFDPAVAAVIRDSRRALRRRLPTAMELVYDNYNFLVFGYCASERPSSAVLSIAAGANGESLCFVQGASLPDPAGLLMGGGKQTRFVRLPSAATLAEPAVEALIEAAVLHSTVPMPTEGGHTVIRSVSAKQRPRRR